MEYADWVNLMRYVICTSFCGNTLTMLASSYDLYGFWDRTNPIGAVVQAHTNLTEIQAATELLWRAGISPKDVVLGVGFYGRSFELKDPECTTPGCPFGELAKPGACTNEGGILGYFEIQQIIAGKSDSASKTSRRDIKPVYDKDAAVKYTVYDDNQWVSFDDKDTFGDKVAWANDVG